MTPTVVKQLRTRGVSQEDMDRFVNYELLPFCSQARQALNYVARTQATIVTDGSNTMTSMWASQDIASGTAVMIEVAVTARSATSRSAFKLVAYFYSQGTVTQEGATATIYSQDAAGLGVALSVVDNHVELFVTDPGGAIPFSWVATIDAQEVS